MYFYMKVNCDMYWVVILTVSS